MEERAEGEVRPSDLPIIRQSIVAASVLDEAVLAEVHLFRPALGCILPGPFRAVDGAAPELLALAETYQLVEYHFQPCLVRDKAGQLADSPYSVRFGVDVLLLVPELARGPADELLLVQLVHQLGRGEEAARVLLGVTLAAGQLPHRHGKAQLQREASVLQDEANPRSIALAGRDGVRIVDEADILGALGNEFKLVLGPAAPQRSHAVVIAHTVQLHGIGRALHQEPLVLAYSGAPSVFDAEDRLPLLVSVALTRVHVFGLALPREVAGGKANHMPLLVPDWNDQAPAVEVIERPALFVFADKP